MLKILIVQNGTLSETLSSTSVINGLRDITDEFYITWATDNTYAKNIFKYTKKCKVISTQDIPKKKFDIFINLDPKFTEEINSDKKVGLHYDDNTQHFMDILYHQKETDLNVFQVYFSLSKMMWHGQGYGFCYFPKTRSSKQRIGLALVNAHLRNFVHENLDVDKKKLWIVPFKKNIFKRLNELNRCHQIITDDMVTLHLAIYLKKYVYFLETINYTMNIELFNQGQRIKVPKHFLT